MIIFPAIDIQGGRCVRLVKGDFATAHQVADDPLTTAQSFRAAGAEWIHMVDLDGAREGRRVNNAVFEQVAAQSGLKVEVGGGIRDLRTMEDYFAHGVSRCILGSAALKDPQLVRDAVAAFGARVAVGIDARDGMVATEGWLDTSGVSYLELARRMEQMGVRTLIFTDIARDGTLGGPNVEQLAALSEAVSCDVVASGGVKSLEDIEALKKLRLYGAICGKSLYSGTLSLADAIRTAATAGDAEALARFFEKSPLIPAVVQDDRTGEVLMLAYMNHGALQRTVETGTTWFWSRSRQEYWNKGATSGNMQQVVSIAGDCDDDTLLLRVIPAGPACHTGRRSCFFNKIL